MPGFSELNFQFHYLGRRYHPRQSPRNQEPSENTPELILAKVLKTIKDNRPPLTKAGLGKQETVKAQVKANILAVDNEKECVDLIKFFLSKKGFNKRKNSFTFRIRYLM